MFEIRVDSISNNKAWKFFWGGGDVTLIFQIFICCIEICNTTHTYSIFTV